MTSMSISLSNHLRNFIKSRVTSGEYHNESEYIRDLVRRDREKLSEEQQILDILRHSRESGVSDYDLPEIMKNVKERLRKDGNL